MSKKNNTEKPKDGLSNSQRKKQAAAAHNAARDIGENILVIGKCGKCKQATFMYLKSNPENICKYYCMGCDHTGSIKDIDKEDSFMYPMIDIVGEVSRHYSPEDFDKAYNS